MDYGGVGQGKKHGDMAIACLESLVRQLGKLYPGRGSGDLYKMVGVTPMIGTNDDASVFGLADANQLTKYARDKKIGLLSYWALQRDQVGKGSLPLYSQQNERDFQFFMAFNNSKPAPTTIPPYSPDTPSIKPSPVAAKPVILKPVAKESVPLSWQSGISYKVGDSVNHLGRGYICTVPHRLQPGWSPEKPSALWSAA